MMPKVSSCTETHCVTIVQNIARIIRQVALSLSVVLFVYDHFSEQRPGLS